MYPFTYRHIIVSSLDGKFENDDDEYD